MSDKISLKATLRKPEDNNKTLRTKGLAPAVVYGDKYESKNLIINKNEFIKLFAQTGEATLIDLDIEGKEIVKVLVKDRQLHSVSDELNHVDFFKINMNKKIHAEVKLTFIGESKAAREKGGVLIKNFTHLGVECLPGDLINHIDVDLSLLSDIGSNIKVADLVVPESVKIKKAATETIALAAEQKAEISKTAEEEAEEEAKVATEEKTEDKEKDQEKDQEKNSK